MNKSNNPYQSPAVFDSELRGKGLPVHWYYTFVAPLATMAIWVGVALLLLGQFITFGLGNGVYWFGVAFIFGLLGTTARKRREKFFAILLVLCCAVFVLDGLSFV